MPEPESEEMQYYAVTQLTEAFNYQSKDLMEIIKLMEDNTYLSQKITLQNLFKETNYKIYQLQKAIKRMMVYNQSIYPLLPYIMSRHRSSIDAMFRAYYKNEATLNDETVKRTCNGKVMRINKPSNKLYRML